MKINIRTICFGIIIIICIIAVVMAFYMQFRGALQTGKSKNEGQLAMTEENKRIS